MSRCYPFPPPGFVLNKTRDESLIESIKKGTKEEEVKREKKDRKHKKDKKRKERETEADRSKKHRHKRRRKDDNAKVTNKVDDGRGLIINNELECLDKSCLTMELEHQTSSQNSCDSTVHSCERPNHIQSPPLDGRHNDSETSIQILLHGKDQKHSEAEVMMTNKDQKQCTLRESLEASQTAPSESVVHTSANEAPRHPLRVCQEKRKDRISGSPREITTKLRKEKKSVPPEDVRFWESISMPLGKEKPYSSHQETTVASKLCSRCPPSTDVRFLNLIENWAPDRVESKLTDFEDQELWLFMNVGAKRHHHQISNPTTSNGGNSSMVWPTARFLPEAQLHALPFTVPF